jgi:hypothetical protein
MKRKTPGNPPRAAVYARFATIRQAFASNSEMARHLFKELPEDGKEHSYREIVGYIMDRAGGVGAGARRMTDETVHSAIWYMFRQDHDVSYIQTRKGYYQKNTAELLLGDGVGSLKELALRVLSEARERISEYAAVPNLSGQERRKLAPLREAIDVRLESVMRQIAEYDAAQAMTAENLEVDGELIMEGDRVGAYLGVWFNADRRFGIQTEGTDAYISLYADFYPADGSLGVYYILHDTDGTEREPVPVTDLTGSERETILKLMRDAGLEECVAEMRSDPDEDTGMTFS